MAMLFLYDTFKPFCERNGIQLLSEDMRFIAKHLSYIPSSRHKVIMKQYYEEWKKGMESDCLPAARMNMGRKAANSFLREAVGDKI